MKKIIIFTIFIIILSYSCTAISLRSSPFAPNPMLFESGISFSKEYTISDYKYPAEPYVNGDLSEYVTLTDIQDHGTSITFTANINLPDTIEKPGMHSIIIGAGEVAPEGAGIAGLARVQKKMDFLVLYDHKFANFYSFSTPNVNENKKIDFEFTAESLSKLDMHNIKGEIYIYNFNKELVKTLEIKPFDLASTEKKSIPVEFDSTGFIPGKYFAEAIIFWEDQNTTLDNDFNIGTLNIEIIDFTKNFTGGQINKIDITIESKWNGNTNFFVELILGKEEQTTTQTYSLGAFERKTITGYLDLTYIEAGKHDLEIKIKYDDLETKVKEKINVVGSGLEKENEVEEPFSISFSSTEIMMILVIIVLIIIVILMLQQNKRKK